VGGGGLERKEVMREERECKRREVRNEEIGNESE
jgi:hypothetical protein